MSIGAISSATPAWTNPIQTSATAQTRKAARPQSVTTSAATDSDGDHYGSIGSMIDVKA
jgi:hypothetical protein